MKTFMFKSTHCTNTHEITLQNINKSTNITYPHVHRSDASRRHNCGGKRHNNVTYFSSIHPDVQYHYGGVSSISGKHS